MGRLGNEAGSCAKLLLSRFHVHATTIWSDKMTNILKCYALWCVFLIFVRILAMIMFTIHYDSYCKIIYYNGLVPLDS